MDEERCRRVVGGEACGKESRWKTYGIGESYVTHLGGYGLG